MLSESKIRQAGFIRNSSSKHIIYHPQAELRQSSSDSFSSFEYQRDDKASHSSNKKQIVNNRSYKVSNKNGQSLNDHQNRPNKVVSKLLTPQIPKPTKKAPLNQPQFQNQKLKNNFFQQNYPLKINQHQKFPVKQFLRTNTPQFMQFESSNFKNDIQNVQIIGNNIKNMKLEGNFSFNPKMHRFKAINLEVQEDEQQQFKECQKIKKQMILNNQALRPIESTNKQAKQINYFNQANKFQYDFQPSSSESSDISSQGSQNQAMRFYEQQRKPIHDQQMKKTIQKYTNAGKISSHQLSPKHITKNTIANNKPIQIMHGNYSNKIQNREENDEQLIVEYSKKDFAPKIKTDSRVTKKQLVQNSSYKNHGKLQPADVYETNGGVCFDIDVKQFSQNLLTTKTNSMIKPKKYKKKNPESLKQEMLRRRQTAKIYSQHARFKLFGYS